MTAGERMVWAAEFVRALRSDDVHSSVAARSASAAVRTLRGEGTEWLGRNGDKQEDIMEMRAMLHDILNDGATK